MKALLLSFTLFCFTIFAAKAQAPNKFNYQGIARNNNGSPMASQNIALRISILDGGSTGPNVYSETQSATTNAYGLYNIAIGGGTTILGSFISINWPTGNKFIKIELDPTGGTNFVTLGNTQLLSVPYAMYAGATSAPTLSLNGNQLTAGGNSVTLPISINYTAGIGIGINGNTVNAQNTNALWNANQLQGMNVNNTAPLSGQILSFNGIEWIPAAPGGNSSAAFGTTNFGAKFTTANAIGNSQIYDNGTTVAVGTISTIASNKFQVLANGTGTAGYFDGGTTGNAILVPNGPVGIGTTAPQNRLSAIGGNTTGIDTNATIFGMATTSISALKGGIYGTYNASNSGVGIQGIGNLGVSYQAAPTFFNGMNPGSDAGVYGSANTAGVIGTSSAGNGLLGFSTNSAGVLGYTAANNTGGVAGIGNTVGLLGNAQTIGASIAPTIRYGIYGTSSGGLQTNYGVIGVASASINSSPSVGTRGDASAFGTGTNYGIYGSASNAIINYAGYFSGNVQIIGTLSKSSGTFKIDHPLDPENKYLSHSFVESPDMMNIYNGNITTDSAGFATVEMPDYFDALNKDFRYQLTVIGAFAQAIVKGEMQGNSFKIQTNLPNIKVSWQVTGVRQDKYANAHRVQPVVDKEAENKGKYLNPVEWGKPASDGIDYTILSNSIHPENPLPVSPPRK